MKQLRTGECPKCGSKAVVLVLVGNDWRHFDTKQCDRRKEEKKALYDTGDPE